MRHHFRCDWAEAAVEGRRRDSSRGASCAGGIAECREDAMLNLLERSVFLRWDCQEGVRSAGAVECMLGVPGREKSPTDDPCIVKGAENLAVATTRR